MSPIRNQPIFRSDPAPPDPDTGRGNCPETVPVHRDSEMNLPDS